MFLHPIPLIGIAAHPAQPELEIVRGDVLERHRVGDGVGAVEIHDVAADRISETEIAVGELDREIFRDVVFEAGMDGPCEILLRRTRRIAAANDPYRAGEGGSSADQAGQSGERL